MRTGPPRERDPNRLTWWDTTWRVLAALLIGGVVWLVTAAVVFPDPATPMTTTMSGSCPARETSMAATLATWRPQAPRCTD